MKSIDFSNTKGIVISGTYSTGKSTTTKALSIATGIPNIDALSAREILTDLYPGRQFQHMSATELLALGLKRLEERIREEAMLRSKGISFISDGSVLNEWIYGTVRMKIGINPGAPIPQQIIKAVMGVAAKPFFSKYLEAYGQVASLHAKEWYTHIVHLPVEFSMDPDGHRPVSERYRTLSDEQMQTEFKSYGKPYYVVPGTPEERVEKIIELLELPQVMDAKEAVVQAKEVLATSKEALAQKMIDQYHQPTLSEKVGILARF